MIEFYKEFGELGYLANYSNYGFYKNGIFYKTVEHYYQSEKYDDKKIKENIINAITPKEASNIGRDRKNIRKKNFKDSKIQVMYEGVLEKFRQNRDIAYKLIETRNKEIAEATIDEYFWGIGKDKSGENNFGKILVKVRNKIKKEILEDILDNCKNKEVYVVGHNYSDADSIFSSYILTRILQRIGINAHFATLNYYGKYSLNDSKLIYDNLNEEPVVVDPDHYFILVDHNNIDKIKKENVIGAFDHHIITGDVYNTLEIEYASTGLLIYDLFKDLYGFDEFEKYLIYLTVLADTNYLNSTRYNDDDRILVNELNLDIDVAELQKKYFRTTDFNLNIENNLNDDFKEYKRRNKKVKRSIISSYNNDYVKYYNKYVDYISKINNYLLIWCNYDKKETIIYFNGYKKVFNYILTSTNIILDYLEKENIL